MRDDVDGATGQLGAVVGPDALAPDQASRGAGRSLVAPGRSLCTTTGSDATGITLHEWAMSVQMTRTLGHP